MPFVAACSGDIFYPTWLLRFVVAVTTAGNLSFSLHYILAGLFTYLLLRRLQVGWTGSVVGGPAYELSGLIASYRSPGHDGKLFASTMLPLILLALVLALRDRRWQGYPLLAAATGLTLLGHFQLAYYSLIVAGLFALYVTLEEAADSKTGERVVRLGLALIAVLVGFGIAAIQIMPFFEYVPFSPRAQGYSGFEGSSSYAIPWDHVPEFFLKSFVGARETYWGSNPIKLHSEYLGLPVVVLAALGVTVPDRRRFVLWVGGIGLLFLLISLGAGTPFFKLWWTVMPLVKKTRAPGMALYVVALVTAMFAGFGVERALRGEGRRVMTPALIVGGIVALLGGTGVFGRVATTPLPYRVLNLPGPGAYPGSALMAFDIPEVFGYHGNELRYYDDLWGGKNEWRNLGVLPLWDLWAVRYATLPAGTQTLDSIPGFRRVLDSVTILDGSPVNLFERTAPAPYARVVAGAIKTDSATIIPTLLDPRMDFSRIVLFTNDQQVAPEPLKAMPAPSPSRAAVTAWQPGRMTVTLDPVPPQPSYLLIAENWYPDWEATADGRPAQLLRGDYTLITVALPAGAKVVELAFRSKLYEAGRTLSVGSLGVLLIALLAAVILPRRARHG